jgi:hypothetical protein
MGPNKVQNGQRKGDIGSSALKQHMLGEIKQAFQPFIPRDVSYPTPAQLPCRTAAKIQQIPSIYLTRAICICICVCSAPQLAPHQTTTHRQLEPA